MKSLDKILYAIDFINEWSGRIFSGLIVVLMLLVVEEVAARYFFKSPHTWGLEVSEFLLLIIVCMGGGYTFLHGGHVRVDILFSKLPSRAQAVIDVLTHTIVLVVAGVIFIYGGHSFLKAYANQSTSFSGFAVILWPFKLFIPIAGFLLGLQTLAKWIRDLVMAFSGMKLESRFVSGEGGIR